MLPRRPLKSSNSRCSSSLFPPSRNLSTSLMCFVIATSLLLAALLVFSPDTTRPIQAETAALPPLTLKELQDLVQDIRGDDKRLMRWDATKYTARKQHHGGCEALPRALDVIVTAASSSASNDKDSQAAALMACEYATFCVTDNPTQRAILSEKDGIHKALVMMAASETNPSLSAMASHVIYIASFANKKNHQGFYQAGAVKALGDVIKQNNKSSDSQQAAAATEDTKPLAVQVMWAAAALQNLAASYCDTEDDGRCYWDWAEGQDHVVVMDEVLPVISDGTSVRKTAVQDKELMDELLRLACQGPVQGEMSESNPYVGENAVIGEHDNASNVIPWAAVGALKNLALEPEAKPMIDTEAVMPCLCRMSHSPDWLEENKGQGVLHHLRHHDPCWFVGKERTHLACIDREFIDDEDYRCDEYGDATKEDCEAKDAENEKVAAKDACCGCGGGHQLEPEESARQEL